MIGDEVMFTVDAPVAAAEIALALSEGTRGADELSDVRVGMAYGPLLEREGDLYGPVVNLASRITAIAFPGSIVVGPSMRDELADNDALPAAVDAPALAQGHRSGAAVGAASRRARREPLRRAAAGAARRSQGTRRAELTGLRGRRRPSRRCGPG